MDDTWVMRCNLWVSIETKDDIYDSRVADGVNFILFYFLLFYFMMMALRK